MAETIEGTFALVPDDSWQSRLQQAQAELAQKTIPAFIEFCREVHAFRLECDNTRGGSEFSRKGCEWLGCSTSSLHRWDAVGRRAELLSHSVGKLPNSEPAIARIASLGDDQFTEALERVEPTMTQADVRDLVREIDPPAPREIDPEDRERKKANRLLDAWRELSPKFRYVVASTMQDEIEMEAME